MFGKFGTKFLHTTGTTPCCLMRQSSRRGGKVDRSSSVYEVAEKKTSEDEEIASCSFSNRDLLPNDLQEEQSYTDIVYGAIRDATFDGIKPEYDIAMKGKNYEKLQQSMIQNKKEYDRLSSCSPLTVRSEPVKIGEMDCDTESLPSYKSSPTLSKTSRATASSQASILSKRKLSRTRGSRKGTLTESNQDPNTKDTIRIPSDNGDVRDDTSEVSSYYSSYSKNPLVLDDDQLSESDVSGSFGVASNKSEFMRSISQLSNIETDEHSSPITVKSWPYEKSERLPGINENDTSSVSLEEDDVLGIMMSEKASHYKLMQVVCIYFHLWLYTIGVFNDHLRWSIPFVFINLPVSPKIARKFFFSIFLHEITTF